MGEFAQLSEVSKAQISAFLHFEKGQRDQINTEISCETADLLSDKFQPDAIYSGKDASESLAELYDVIDRTVDRELERQRDISVLLLQVICAQSQKRGIDMDLQLEKLNDEDLVDEAHYFAGELLTRAASPTPPRTADAEADLSEEELAQLKAENEAMRQKLTTPVATWDEFKQAMKELQAKNKAIAELRQ